MSIKVNVMVGRKPPFDITSSIWKNVVYSGVSPRYPILSPQPFEMNSHEISYSDMSYTDYICQERNETARTYSGRAGEPTGPFTDVNNLKQLSMNAFLDHCASVRVNLLDMYRTRLQTANMVVSKMMTLYNAYSNLRKGNFKQFKRTLGITGKRPTQGWDNIPKLWLEYSYGWAPLISDVYTMLNKTFEVPSMYVRRVYRYQSDHFSRTGTNGTNQGDGINTAYWSHQFRGVTSGYVTVNQPALQAIAQYGITNPALVAWEAIPFSFVADWFVPIGDYIDKMGSTAGLLFKECSTTCTVTTKGSASYDVYTWGPCGNGKAYYRHGFSDFTYRYKKRFVETPTYSFGNISSPLDQSITRYSYALSLLSSIFGRR